jgi:NCAIR mutase (PurE)-related protein
MVSPKITRPSIALLCMGALLASAVVEARAPATSSRRRSVSKRSRANPVVNNQVIFCGNKSPKRVASDFGERIRSCNVIIGTKATRAQFDALRGTKALKGKKLDFDEASGVITFRKGKIPHKGLIVVAAAGKADIPVAEEAARIAEAMGNKVQRVYGLKKADRESGLFNKPNAIIAISGKDKGLPNAIAALTQKPVIAVPTKRGYGTGLKGLAAMAGMLKKSSPGVTAVNIDNGFGAAYVADRINKQSLPGASASKQKNVKQQGLIVVTTAGTADIPVAETAAQAAEAMGNKVLRVYDCGVNNPKKVARNRSVFNKPNAIIAAAGLEGGLPNAVAAMTSKPVIAVPTSVGYGTGAGGVSALMGMLNACSPGITVVNIDNGAGAARMADKINKQSVH